MYVEFKEINLPNSDQNTKIQINQLDPAAHCHTRFVHCRFSHHHFHHTFLLPAHTLLNHMPTHLST